MDTGGDAIISANTVDIQTPIYTGGDPANTITTKCWKSPHSAHNENKWQAITRRCLTVVIPLALIPLAAIGTKEASCAYTVILMAMYWILQPVPLAVTALLPTVLYPLFGILSTAKACSAYASQPVMFILSGMILAIALEHSGLHHRISIKVLLLLGTKPQRLLVGFIVSSGFLSMWMNNLAVTAMMIPIAEEIIEEKRKQLSILKDKNCFEMENEEPSTGPTQKSKITDEKINLNQEDNYLTSIRDSKMLRKAFLLCIAYSSSIGGTGTLLGGGTKIILLGMINQRFPECSDITFGSWMLFALPGMIVCLIICGLVISFLFLKNLSKNEKSSKSVKAYLQQRYDRLGPIGFHQSAVSFLFIILIILLLFQDPKIFPGWTAAFPETKIQAATPAMFVALLLFFIPSKPLNFKSSPPLLEWKLVQKKVPWGLLILIGGGFSMAQGFQESGLSDWLKEQLSGLQALPIDAVLIILLLLSAGLTELTTNMSATTCFLPVMADLATVLSVNPLYLMVPVTIACSYAFMLPMATAPNALVYQVGKMSTKDMAIPGFFMNILCCAVTFASVNSIGILLFDIRDVPEWARLETFTANISTLPTGFEGTASTII